MESLEHVNGVHHVHVWQLDENQNALEAHIVVNNINLKDIEQIKATIKRLLLEQFGVHHSTLEFEL